MPELMVMIHADEAEEARLAPAETKALVEGHAAFERSLRAASAYLDGERLRPSSEGRRVTAREGTLRVEPGPFETPLVAYWVVRAETLEAAVALAQACPLPPGASIEVRPVMKGAHTRDKTSRPGRVFAFAVLGHAPDEPAWIDVMDRIDARTRDHFPGDRWLGGLRLEAPRRGRRVTSSRVVLDGPFLESREVIGGIFFMRMTSVEEAVRWAAESEFVKLGALEIRELWRS